MKAIILRWDAQMVVNETKLRKEAYDKLFGKQQEQSNGPWLMNYSLLVLSIVYILFEKGYF
jgi:hypothetical protein